MSYVQHVLQPGEIIRHQTKLHWMVYVPGLLLLVLAGAVFWFAPSSGSGWDWNWATFVRIVGLIVLAAEIIVLAVTTVHMVVFYAVTRGWRGPIALAVDLSVAATLAYWLQRRFRAAQARAR